MNDYHVDVLVVGAGPGGYVAAIRCAQLGLTTAIVERSYWGGVCLNLGCIPSKALLRHAEISELITKKAAMFGIRGNPTVDYGAAFSRSRTVAAGRAKGIHYLMAKNGIQQFRGHARFLDPRTVCVEGDDNATVHFAHAIIATGASPRLLPGTTLSARVKTYAEQILAEQVPASIAIVGAGAIGVEFAYLLNAFGVTVALIEVADRILPLEDADVSAELAKRFKRSGISIHTATTVEDVDDSERGVVLRTIDGEGVRRELHAETVLQSIGFVPNTLDLGLDAIGVATDARGAVIVDSEQRTTVSHLFAIGDVTAALMLAHVAEAQGLHAAATIAGYPSAPLNYPMMPRATFCHPQVASFGWTEHQARQHAVDNGWDVEVVVFPFTANGKAHGLGETAGFVKLVHDRSRGELLGAHMVGPDVAELLPELTLAQRAGLTPLELAGNVHTHPTLSEALQETFHGLTGHMINF